MRTFNSFVILVEFVAFIFLSNSCKPKSYTATSKKTVIVTNKMVKDAATSPEDEQLQALKKAEAEASEAGRAILETGRKMALDEKVIIKGACWDWVNECFNRAGYGKEKHIAYKSKKAGPFVNTDKIQPGDWLYYINYSYNKIEHSGIFVYWVDKKKKIGMILSYGGERRKEPGRYREYLLKDVYYITRAGTK